MENRINIAELLKDCPKGMELYSPIFGTVYFEGIRDTGRAILIDVTTSCNTSVQFYSDGKFNTCYSESEVTLFPSKSQRDWSKFQRPFKDGDVLFHSDSASNGIFIFKEILQRGTMQKVICYCDYDSEDGFCLGENHTCCWTDSKILRLATKEEKEKLFKAIKDNGYKWNDETKTLEKLIEPKFKVGDRITNGKVSITIGYIDDNYYYEFGRIIANRLFIKNQDDWKLVPNKFDITTLKPFDKVLARDTYRQVWIADFFSHIVKEPIGGYRFACIGHYWHQCIPYENNEHLLNTTDDCDEYYKTW